MISPESTCLDSLVWIQLQLLTGSAEAGGMCTKHFLQETKFNVDVCSQSENLLVAQKHTLVLNRQGSGNNETILFYLRSRRLSETISLFPTLLTRVQTASLTSWNMYQSGHDTALAPEPNLKILPAGVLCWELDEAKVSVVPEQEREIRTLMLTDFFFFFHTETYVWMQKLLNFLSFLHTWCVMAVSPSLF